MNWFVICSLSKLRSMYMTCDNSERIVEETIYLNFSSSFSCINMYLMDMIQVIIIYT